MRLLCALLCACQLFPLNAAQALARECAPAATSTGRFEAAEAVSSAMPQVETWAGESGRGRIVLRLWPDHFFVLGFLDGKHARDVTGLWRESPDGVNLELYNAQDLEIRLSRGKEKIYAGLGALGLGYAELQKNSNAAHAPFRADGILEAGGKLFTDAPSGMNFPVDDAALQGLETASPLFVSAEIADGRVGRIISHTSHLPRVIAYASEKTGCASGPAWKTFAENVAGRHWLLPRLPGVEKASILFVCQNSEKNAEQGEKSRGLVEISGPGLHGEGTFMLDGPDLSIALNAESRDNLAILGAGSLARAIEGDFGWQVMRDSLSLVKNGQILRLLGHFP